MTSLSTLILIAVIGFVSTISFASAGDFHCLTKSGSQSNKCGQDIKHCFIEQKLDEEDNNTTEAGCFTGDASTLEVGCVTKDGPPKKKVCYCSESNCNTKAFLNGGVSTKAKFASIALAVAMIYFVL